MISLHAKNMFKILALSLILSPLSSWASSNLIANGKIEEISSNHIIITDTRFKILPTVKVFLDGKKPLRLQDLKKGDFVRLHLLNINNTDQVEKINMLTNP